MFYSSIFGHPQFLILAMPMLDRHLVYALTVSLELVITIHLIRIFTARRYAQARSLLSSCVSVRPSVCPSGWWSSNFLFDPVAPSSLFYPKCQCLIQRETPSAGAQKYTGWEFFFAIFDWNRRLSRKWYEIGPWLLWNVNRKSQVADRSELIQMTLSDPKPGFQGQVKYQRLGTKLL